MERVEDPRTGRLVVTGNTYAPNLKCLKRNLSSRHCLNMGSYNYLGFGGVHELITPQIIKTAIETGVGLRTPKKFVEMTFQIATCPLLLGISQEQRFAELAIAEFLHKEDAIIVPMGFATNSTIIPCLVGHNCLIISDSLNHASICTGARCAR